MNTINKLNFDLELVEGKTINDIKLEIKTNGELNNNYGFDNFEVYLYNDNINVCNIDNEQALSKDYVIKSNETYVINIEELTFKNMEYSGAIWQSEDTVFINSNDISNLEHYCMGTQKEEGSYESFTFTFSDVKENTNQTETQNTLQTDTQTTQQIESQNQYESVPNNDFIKSNTYMTLLYGVILCLIIVVIILIVKLKKSNNK